VNHYSYERLLKDPESSVGRDCCVVRLRTTGTRGGLPLVAMTFSLRSCPFGARNRSDIRIQRIAGLVTQLQLVTDQFAAG